MKFVKWIIDILAMHKINFISWIYKRVYFLYSNTVLKSDINKNYEDLAPIINIEEVDKEKVYRNALDYAMNNEHVDNIAIIGPYGSGKSSLVNSYIKYTGLSNKQCLIISLSTFTNKCEYFTEIGEEDDQIKYQGNHDTESKNFINKSSKPINELEASILEQILYSNEEKSHKYSRLKRINVPIKRKAFFQFLMLCVFFLSVSCIFDSRVDDFIVSLINSCTSLIGIPFNGINAIDSIIVKGIIVAIIILNDFVVLFNFYRKVTTFTKINLSFSKVNLEFKSSNGESLLDKYIDEIFNFFKHNNYRFVIFEDLDRYQNIDIFERLKRINRLLNEVNNKRSRGIKFIYTVGDHMFDDSRFKERTKFFDFVLPIIPIIDSTNSICDLKHSFDKFELKDGPNEQLMKDVSFFIDDMRTLKNISNEFITYYNILSDSEDKSFADKLFSMICYKNRYPYDFSMLQEDSGFLYNFIEECNNFRDEIVKAIEDQIIIIENRINTFEKEIANTVQELNYIYIMYLVKKVGRNSLIRFDKTGKQSGNYNKEQLTNLTNLKEIFGDYRFTIRQNYNNISLGLEDITTLGGTSDHYNTRIERITLMKQDELIQITRQLEDLRQEKENCQYAKVATIISKNLDSKKIISFQKSYPMVFYFVVNSYIENDYYKYIGHFKEGHMTSNDKKFLAYIKSKQSLKLDFKLNTPKAVIDSLVTDDFYIESVLNYSLINYLQKTDDYRFKSIISKHYSKDEFMIKYLSGFIKWNKINEKGKIFEQQLMEIIFVNSNTIGKYIIKNKISTEEYDENILNYFVGEMLAKVLIQEENTNNFYFCEFFLKHNDYKKILPFIKLDPLKELLIKLSEDNRKIQRFVILEDHKNEFREFVDFVYEQGLYKFTYENTLFIINRYSGNSYEVMNANDFFDNIKKLELSQLLNMIRENVENFINNILNRLNLLELLHSNNLSFCINEICKSIEDVEKVFKVVDSRVLIDDITSLGDSYWSVAIKNSRIYPTYYNVFKYLCEKGIDNQLIDYYVSHIDEFDRPDNDFDDQYINELYDLINNLNDDTILKRVNTHFKTLEFSFDLLTDNDKVKQLIRNRYKIIIDENLINAAEKDDELMILLLNHHSNEIINYESNIYINSNVLVSVYSKIDFSCFMILFNKQISINEVPQQFIIEIVNNFEQNHLLQYLKNEEDIDNRYNLISDYIMKNEIDKNFVTNVMPIIDNALNDFKVKDHFSVEGSDRTLRLLEKLKNLGFINFKQTSTGKLEIWIYKNRSIS